MLADIGAPITKYVIFILKKGYKNAFYVLGGWTNFRTSKSINFGGSRIL